MAKFIMPGIVTTDFPLKGPTPKVEATIQEVENASGFGGGPTLVSVRIENDNGEVALFWISAKINKQNRPVVEVATELGRETIVRKSVTGACNKL